MVRLVGSPPHVWRILDNQRFFKARTRITSTCVENTLIRIILIQCCKDHLHMCGEYITRNVQCLQCLGSPPHVWRIREAIAQGFEQFMDHLHMCGEYGAGTPLKK